MDSIRVSEAPDSGSIPDGTANNAYNFRIRLKKEWNADDTDRTDNNGFDMLLCLQEEIIEDL